ncbi:MAG: alpha/beta hydrolase [Candidatus Bathyarchaeota archaeon]|nr:alpha/beta hydrolase [Candidatus Bathyarchaeota archaeon]
MPFVTNRDVRIHYELEGKGPALVLHHGLTSNLQSWRIYGYTDALKADYRLILVDARGHGASDKPHDIDAYSPEIMTSDIVAVLDAVNVNQAHFWGYSMGAHIGFNVSQYCPTRFRSFILGGHSPLPRSDAVTQAMNRITGALRIGAEDGPAAFLAFQEVETGQAVSSERWQRILKNDFCALYALWQNIFAWPLTSDRVSQIAVPCLLYAGDQDPCHNSVKMAASQILNARFLSFAGLTHGMVTPSRRMLPHVKWFLSQKT